MSKQMSKQYGGSKFLPLGTALAMVCATSPAQSNSWGSSYTSEPNRTANTVIRTSGLRSRTASRLQSDSNSGESVTAEVSVWAEPIQDLRNSLHATVKQIAQALNVKRQSVHGWQRGEKVPSRDNQLRIAELQVAAQLLTSVVGPQLPVYLNHPLTPSGETFWDLLSNQLSPADAAEALIRVAQKSLSNRRALRDAFAGRLATQPLDLDG